MKQYRGILIAFAAVLAVGAGAIMLFTKQYWIALGVLGAGLLWLGAMALMFHTIANQQQERMDRVFRENDSAVASIAGNVSVPCAIVDLSGRITLYVVTGCRVLLMTCHSGDGVINDDDC